MSIWETIVDTVTSVVANVLPSLSKVLPTSIGEIPDFLRGLAVIVEAVAEFFGLGKQDIEDNGNRRKQAEDAGWTQEEFDTYDEYVEFVKNFELDPEKTQKISTEEKLAYGISFVSDQIEAKTGLCFEAIMPVIMNSRLNAGQVSSLLETFSKAEMDLDKVADYCEDKLGSSETGQVEDTILNAFKDLPENVGKSEDELRDMVQEMR